MSRNIHVQSDIIKVTKYLLKVKIYCMLSRQYILSLILSKWIHFIICVCIAKFRFVDKTMILHLYRQQHYKDMIHFVLRIFSVSCVYTFVHRLNKQNITFLFIYSFLKAALFGRVSVCFQNCLNLYNLIKLLFYNLLYQSSVFIFNTCHPCHDNWLHK